jgi:hypothetical protein
MLGAIFTMAVSIIVSLYFGFNKAEDVAPELITPMLRKRLFKSEKTVQDKSLLPATVKDTEF